MPLSFKGDQPFPAQSISAKSVSDAHVSSRNRTLRLTALKKAVVKAIVSSHQISASEQLQDAEWALREGVLEIKTGLSQQILSAIISDKVHNILRSVLDSHTTDKYIINVLARTAAASATQVGGIANSTSKLDDDSASPFENAFDKLTQTATRLNQISDNLNKQIEAIDATLKRLNLGVSTWAKFSESSDEDGTVYVDEIGYTRLSTR